MKRVAGGALALALAFGVVSPLGAEATAPHDRVVSLGLGQDFTWTGSFAAQGANTGFDPAAGGPCGKTRDTYCDLTLVHIDVPAAHWETHAGSLDVFINWTGSAAEYDLYIYRSDIDATPLQLVATGATIPPRTILGESARAPNPSEFYLVIVVYRAAVRALFNGTAIITSQAIDNPPDEPAWFPPDVDDPPGVPDVLASDPVLGFRSHSEPHLAQSPIDSDVLVAGSKMYNLDPDSLEEYEFKIGTYASFNRGASWADLGQMAVCPPGTDHSPGLLEYYPCYPADDPARDGTGGEDMVRGGGGDAGEEYITSDIWTQFDDEGNAYAMVLDAPPGGSGWGMTMHRWDSVAADDVTAGTTWGPRLPIHEYADPATPLIFLDDKNTFAVNNAGPDGDGVTGPIVACWGQVATAKQVIVCSRSIDRGETWLPPVPVSSVDAQVIGVHVVADPVDPNTFYATWFHEAFADQTIDVAVSVDGGLTWIRRPAAVSIDGLPRQFSGQAFRNLSIPIMAAANDGTLFITYAATGHSLPLDDDGGESDVFVIASTNGGLTWSSPRRASTETANDGLHVNTAADQFQPYIAVTPSGQLNVAYFDRRMDPWNYFVDVWLSRSEDGGLTWTQTRLSHEMGDPQLNAPVSSWGLFFGDYQGLVADDCGAIAAFNHNHLAYAATRDPDFDDGSPRSLFQQLHTWAVPNTPAYGGSSLPC